MGLSLARALRLQPSGEPGSAAAGQTIAFVGAGGKTTAMFQLARELRTPALVTTTTHLGTWQAGMADHHIVAAQPDDLPELPVTGVILITGVATAEGRLGSVSPAMLMRLHDIARERGIPLLVEADGARQRPLKAPSQDEPNIPPFAEMVVVVAGISALGRPMTENLVHRPERFAALSRLPLGDPITPEALTRVLTHPEGGLRNVPPAAHCVLLLNQADTSDLQGQAHGMARGLLTAYDSVIVAALQENETYAVHEHSAGIVLAAGASTRLGRPKQLLDWHGQPFVRAVAQTALTAGLDPVIVVTGADAQGVESVLAGLPIRVVHNGDWQSGQASSVRVGLENLPPRTGSAVFLLADQPQVTFGVIQALVDTHSPGLFPIVAPLVMMERRANPVLFDRDAFPDLMVLEGDVGGRAIFSKHRVEFMPWHDDRLLLDVDTEADYRRLVEDDTL